MTEEIQVSKAPSLFDKTDTKSDTTSKNNKKKVPKTLDIDNLKLGMNDDENEPSVAFTKLSDKLDKALDKGPKTAKLSEDGQKYKDKILRYINLFPDDLKEYKHKDLHKLNDNDLANLLDEVRSKINSSANSNIYKTVTITGCGLLESVGPSFGAQLQGMTQTVTYDKNINRILKEVQAEYGNPISGNIPPLPRLAFAIGFVGYQTHMKNSTQVKQQQPQQDYIEQDIESDQEDEPKMYTVAQSVVDKYADL